MSGQLVLDSDGQPIRLITAQSNGLPPEGMVELLDARTAGTIAAAVAGIAAPVKLGSEAARAANTTVPTAASVGSTNEGGLYVADGTVAWKDAPRIAKAADVAAAQTAAAADATAKQGVIDAKVGTNAVAWDGATDDTAKLTALAAAAVAANLPLRLPPGMGRVSTWVIPSGLTVIGPGSGNCTIKQLSSATGTGAVTLNLSNTTRVTIQGVTIDGNLSAFGGVVTEQKHGIFAPHTSFLALTDVVSTNHKGDGLYLGHSSIGISTDTLMTNCRMVGDWRNGLSIINAQRFKAIACQFTGTSGTAPQFGVDIEPNLDTDTIDDIGFVGCNFDGNVGGGFSVVLRNTPTARQAGIYCDSTCTASNNTGPGVLLQNARDFTWEGAASNNSSYGVTIIGLYGTTVSLPGRVTGNQLDGVQLATGNALTELKLLGHYWDNGKATAATYDGVNVQGTVTRIIMLGATSGGPAGTTNQRYGITAGASVASLSMLSCSLVGNATGPANITAATVTRVDSGNFTLPSTVKITTLTAGAVLADSLVLGSAGFPNLLTVNESSFETDASAWQVASGAATLAASTAAAWSGTKSMSLTAPGTNVAMAVFMRAANQKPVVAGTQYTVLARVRAATTVRPVSCLLYWYDASKVFISTTTGTTVTGETTVSWFQTSLTATAPAGAAYCSPSVRVQDATTITNGEVHYVDGVDFHQGSSTSYSAPGVTPGLAFSGGGIANNGAFNVASAGGAPVTVNGGSGDSSGGLLVGNGSGGTILQAVPSLPKLTYSRATENAADTQLRLLLASLLPGIDTTVA